MPSGGGGSGRAAKRRVVCRLTGSVPLRARQPYAGRMAVRVGTAPYPSLSIAPAPAALGPVFTPLCGRPSLDAADDRLLVSDIVGPAMARRVEHLPVAALLDADAGQLAALGLRAAAGRRLLAAAELARRFQPAMRPGLPCELPQHLLPHLAGLRAAPVEVLAVLALDARLALLGGLCPVAGGALMQVSVTAREVFAPAIERRAAAIVLAHNHPSGDPSPSRDDQVFTDRMARAGALLGIQLLDHLVVARRSYFSFAAAGRLEVSR
jgi:DNA repair protein RadC